jgi:crotonobetainyl-CoA:carnitine CoA-transferase CaiB-like acyl-CoA transferase
VAPYQVFHTADRPIAIAVGSEKLWAAFCGAIGRAELAAHPDYASNAARIRNRAALEPLLEGIFGERPAAEWVARLQTAGIPVSPVRNFEEVVEHPQCETRRMFPTLDHPSAGAHRVTGTPIKLSGTPGAPGRPAPRLGEHTADALRELLDLDEKAIVELEARGIILPAPPESA